MVVLPTPRSDSLFGIGLTLAAGIRGADGERKVTTRDIPPTLERGDCQIIRWAYGK